MVEYQQFISDINNIQGTTYKLILDFTKQGKQLIFHNKQLDTTNDTDLCNETKENKISIYHEIIDTHSDNLFIATQIANWIIRSKQFINPEYFKSPDNIFATFMDSIQSKPIVSCKTGKVFSSTNEAVKTLGISVKSLRRCLNNPCAKAKDSRWTYLITDDIDSHLADIKYRLFVLKQDNKPFLVTYLHIDINIKVTIGYMKRRLISLKQRINDCPNSIFDVEEFGTYDTRREVFIKQCQKWMEYSKQYQMTSCPFQSLVSEPEAFVDNYKEMSNKIRGLSLVSSPIICTTTNTIFELVNKAANAANVSRTLMSKTLAQEKYFAGILPDGTPLEWEYYIE